jgi:uncharacterized membrane protein YhaH (DUF805 family)
MNDSYTQFGVDTTHVVLQVLLVLHLCLWIVALLRVARAIRGLGALGWIVLAFFVPFIGSIAAMIAARNHPAYTGESR